MVSVYTCRDVEREGERELRGGVRVERERKKKERCVLLGYI